MVWLVRYFHLYQVSWAKKFNLIFLFFLLRKLILPFYSFTLFCIILPLTMFLPEAELPAWVVCYIPGAMSLLSVLPAPRSFPFIVPYLLFENTMSVTKFNAMISGLFRFGSSYEWVVTKKLGRSSETDLVAFEKESEPLMRSNSLHRSNSDSGLEELSKLELSKKTGKTKRNRLFRKELCLAFILLTASVRSLLSAQGIHFYFLLFQGISFLVVGLDLIGEQVSWCPDFGFYVHTNPPLRSSLIKVRMAKTLNHPWTHCFEPKLFSGFWLPIKANELLLDTPNLQFCLFSV